MPYSLTVNGRITSVEAAPDTPLLWVLRESFGLTATKFGCGAGQCGACTVHVDGAAVRSCQIPVSEAEGLAITTFEGISGPVANAVKDTWLANDVVECGYCQVGQMMTAAALLTDNQKPTDTDIDVALRGSICRCGIYDRIRQAVHTAAASVEG